MKQLIPQSKIDESAIDHLHYCIRIGEYNRSELSFDAGVKFALTEIEPFIIEFANYVLRELWNPTNISESKSTQELLEEFIKSKNE